MARMTASAKSDKCPANGGPAVGFRAVTARTPPVAQDSMRSSHDKLLSRDFHVIGLTPGCINDYQVKL